MRGCVQHCTRILLRQCPVASLNRASLRTARAFGSTAAAVDFKTLFNGADTIDATTLKSVPMKSLLASLHSERMVVKQTLFNDLFASVIASADSYCIFYLLTQLQLEFAPSEAQIDVAFRLILDPYTPVEFDATASSPSSACTRTLDTSISSHAIPSSVVLANWKHMSMLTLVWSLLDSLLSRRMLPGAVTLNRLVCVASSWAERTESVTPSVAVAAVSTPAPTPTSFLTALSAVLTPPAPSSSVSSATEKWTYVEQSIALMHSADLAAPRSAVDSLFTFLSSSDNLQTPIPSSQSLARTEYRRRVAIIERLLNILVAQSNLERANTPATPVSPTPGRSDSTIPSTAHEIEVDDLNFSNSKSPLGDVVAVLMKPAVQNTSTRRSVSFQNRNRTTRKASAAAMPSVDAATLDQPSVASIELKPTPLSNATESIQQFSDRWLIKTFDALVSMERFSDVLLVFAAYKRVAAAQPPSAALFNGIVNVLCRAIDQGHVAQVVPLFLPILQFWTLDSHRALLLERWFVAIDKRFAQLHNKKSAEQSVTSGLFAFKQHAFQSQHLVESITVVAQLWKSAANAFVPATRSTFQSITKLIQSTKSLDDADQLFDVLERTCLPLFVHLQSASLFDAHEIDSVSQRIVTEVPAHLIASLITSFCALKRVDRALQVLQWQYEQESIHARISTQAAEQLWVQVAAACLVSQSFGSATQVIDAITRAGLFPLRIFLLAMSEILQKAELLSATATSISSNPNYLVMSAYQQALDRTNVAISLSMQQRLEFWRVACELWHVLGNVSSTTSEDERVEMRKFVIEALQKLSGSSQ